MKFNKWTLGLATVGAVSLASAARADEAQLTALNTALSNTTISGYVDVAAQYNPGQPSPSQSAAVVGQPVGLNPNKVDNFSINCVSISLDKPLDESAWASGYHIDINAGSDAITPLNSASTSTTVIRNFDGNPSALYSAQSSTSISSVGIRQGYVALRTPVGNGIDWKVGLWDGVTGYEANTGYLNPNYTRSYGYQVNPASEAGIIGSYKIIDEISVMLGMANRVSGFAAGLSSHDYIAAVALTAPDSFGFLKGSVVNFQTVQTFDNGGVNNYNVNATLNTPVTGLKLGFSYDVIQTLQAGGGDGNIFGLYACYQATDKLAFNLRGEYVDTTDFGWFSPSGRGAEVTATVQYDLWANVVSRVEFRWDHTDQGAQFNANNQANAYLLALNLVYKF
jgi:hypothetical protein